MSAPSSPTQSPLLGFRLSRHDFQQQVARARQSRPTRNALYRRADPSKEQAVVIRGYNDDARTAISSAMGGKDVLNASYIMGSNMSTIVEQAEDALLIPGKHWRITSKSTAMNAEDHLIHSYGEKATARPVELILVPEDAIVDFLAKHCYMREWKRLKPSRVPPLADRAGALARAQSLFHLLSPPEDQHWAAYIAQRQDAEWTFIRMKARFGCMEMAAENFLDTIKYQTRLVLERTKLTAKEQAAVADGVLPQRVKAEDGPEGVYWHEVTAFTRVFSPTRPAVIDVRLQCPSPGTLSISYSIHSPALPIDERPKDHYATSWATGGGTGGTIFSTEAPYEKRCGLRDIRERQWSMRKADAKHIHDVLFGPLGDKVSIADAVLLLLNAAGFHMQLWNKNTGNSNEVKFTYNGDPQWHVGEMEWIETNLGKACGCPGIEAELVDPVIVDNISEYE